jgi:hypothetical protein
LLRLFWSTNCIGRVRILLGYVVLPFSDEIFLREHRYRDVAFGRCAKKFPRKISELGNVCRLTANPLRGRVPLGQ